MVDQRLIDYIKSELSKGVSQNQIKQVLLSNGWPVDDVNQALNLAVQGAPPSETSSISQPVQKSSKLWIYIAISIAVLIVIVVFVFFMIGGKEESAQEQSLLSEGAQLTGQQIIDCGSDESCFTSKFAECIPAKFTAALTGTIIYYYQIIGPKDGFCEVKSMFLANPNPEWVGKEMTCEYDNSIDFLTSIQDLSRCQGPLYTLMTSG